MFALSALEGVISPDYSIFGAIGELDAKYFELLFRTPILVDQFAQHSKGIGSGFNRLYTPDFGAIPSMVPPLPEQAAIVRYLDYMDRRIRRYIRAKQKLIKLLEEQKHAIIHQAVTRGLDPNVPLKPSGVEWLGDVPTHWEVRRLKRIFRDIIGGSTPSTDHSEYWNGDVVWITPSDISKTNRLTTSERMITSVGLAACATTIVPPGSIIVTTRAPVGNVAVAEVVLCTNQGCKALVMDQSVLDPLYGYLMIKLLTDEMKSLATGTTFYEISTGKLGVIVGILPSLLEQNAIVAFLANATSGITSAIDTAQREIALLREYRTRLIADVVTGKLDVREAAANLPDEVEEPEPLEEIVEVEDEETNGEDDGEEGEG